MINIDPQEKIVLVLRKHWFYILVEILVFLMLVLGPLAGMFYAQNNLPIEFTLNTFVWITYLVWVIFLWNGFFVLWTNFFLDIWIVTDKRIVDVEQRGLFSRETSTLRIEKIQDVTIDVHGIIATFLKIGDVHVQTAGSEKEFVIYGARHPQQVKETILKLHDQKLESAREVTVVETRTEQITSVPEPESPATTDHY